MTPLRRIIHKLWDGAVCYQEATENFNSKQIEDINRFLTENKEVFKEGVPFPDESPEYSKLLERHYEARLLQKMIDYFE